jgi:hypothetical protein
MSVGQSMLGLDSATLNTRLNNIAALGIGWLRFDIQWDNVQPTNSASYNWGSIDPFVAAAAAHHIKLLAILDYTPQWAKISTCTFATDRCAPASTGPFAAFAKTAVERYAGQGISDWEIWNEPNSDTDWSPAASPSGYTALLKVAYVAIKSTDPSAMVITGGLSPAATGNGTYSPIDFLTGMYADGAEPYFDAVGFHPYSYPAMPLYVQSWNAWSQMASTNPSLQSIMATYGDASKKIWITEYGAPTGGPGTLESSALDTVFKGSPDHVTESLQSTMFAQAITSAESSPWIGPLFFYTYQDSGTSTSTIENFFGVVRHDGSDKPAYTTIGNLIN